MQSSLVVIAGPTCTKLAKTIAGRMGACLLQPEIRIFSDGETKVRLEGVALEGKTCIIVQSTYPPVDSNLLQTLMLAYGCQEQRARQVIAVIPYLGYARQDRAFLQGEVISVELVSRLMASAGITRLVTVDIHSTQAMSRFSFKVDNLTAIPSLAAYVSNIGLKNPIAVSPDSGGAERARQFANLLQCDVISLKKTRDRQTGNVEIENSIGVSLHERDALLIDDMISSGASIAKASEVLRKNGAKRVIAVCTHALLIDGAADKIKSAGVANIIASNSVPSEHSVVDLAPIIADNLGPSLLLDQKS